MKKYKVTFYLMIDPSKGDATFKKSYEVEAESSSKAISQAEALKDAEYDSKYGELNKRCVFNQKAEEVIEEQ